MKKKEISLSDMISVACVSTVAFLSLMLFQYWPDLNNELLNRNEQLVSQNIELIKENHKSENEIKEANIFKKILSEIKRDEYDRSNNNCVDYSKRLQLAFRELGIESTIMVRSDRGHAWLAVWVEPTNGEFLAPDLGWDILELRDHNMEVILYNNKLTDPGVILGGSEMAGSTPSIGEQG